MEILKSIRNVKKRGTWNIKKDIRCDKVENFFQHVKQGPFYVCTIRHWSLYQGSVRLFKHENYHILILCKKIANGKRWIFTAQKMKFFIKDFFSECDQICSFMLIWSYLLKKSLMEIFFFCAVFLKLSKPFATIS